MKSQVNYYEYRGVRYSDIFATSADVGFLHPITVKFSCGKKLCFAFTHVRDSKDKKWCRTFNWLFPRDKTEHVLHVTDKGRSPVVAYG